MIHPADMHALDVAVRNIHFDRRYVAVRQTETDPFEYIVSIDGNGDSIKSSLRRSQGATFLQGNANWLANMLRNRGFLVAVIP